MLSYFVASVEAVEAGLEVVGVAAEAVEVELDAAAQAGAEVPAALDERSVEAKVAQVAAHVATQHALGPLLAVIARSAHLSHERTGHRHSIRRALVVLRRHCFGGGRCSFCWCGWCFWF